MLVWGLYLTHSRGGIIALVVILMLALRSRVNLVAAALAGVLAFGAMTALNFSGGREISLQAGSNRFMLWGDGLALFKSAPLFGVGYENFANANKGQTAHNSFIVCLAELGLFGYLFWMALVVFTITGLNSLMARLGIAPDDGSPGPAQGQLPATEEDESEIRRWAVGVRLSLAAFLVAAFFLSRAYALILFLSLGMAVVLSGIASKDEVVIEEPIWKRLGLSAGIGVATIALVYCMIRVGNALALDKNGFL
jgi:putative inorganic carbon (hco3(-)) transporter